MAKSRKTLRQKKLADLHAQQSSPVSFSPPSYSYTSAENTDTSSLSKSEIVSPNLPLPDIKNDLRKTILLTCGIVVAELVLFFVL